MDEKNTSYNLLHAIDEISELIYICDLETYELLYINEVGKRKFHLEDYQSQKCYKVLQGQEVPCSFCTSPRLRPGEVYTWEFINPLLNRTFALKDRLVDWNGKLARLEIAFDITELRQEKFSLEYALKTEKFVLNCIKILYQQRELSSSLNQVLQELGEYLYADRAYIFNIENDRLNNTYEWCASGVAPQMGNLQNVHTSIMDPWSSVFSQQKCVIIEDVSAIPQDDLRQILERQQINRLVIAPLENNGKLFGYLGVDNPPARRLENIASMLETLRYFIMITFQRDNDARLLERLSFYDALTGLLNRNKYIIDLHSFPPETSCVGVAYVDVNGLKEVNDRYGHTRGDQLLISCCEKLSQRFPKAYLYRIGGDEFTMICFPIGERDFLDRAELLRQDFNQDPDCKAALGFQWAERPISIQGLIALADQAMYQDKREFYQKQNGHPVYEEQP